MSEQAIGSTSARASSLRRESSAPMAASASSISAAFAAAVMIFFALTFYDRVPKDDQPQGDHRPCCALQQGKYPSLHFRGNDALEYGKERAIGDGVHEPGKEHRPQGQREGVRRSQPDHGKADTVQGQGQQTSQSSPLEATPDAESHAARHHPDAKGRLERGQVEQIATEVLCDQQRLKRKAREDQQVDQHGNRNHHQNAGQAAQIAHCLTQLGHQVVTRTQIEVVGIGEHQRGAQLGQLFLEV